MKLNPEHIEEVLKLINQGPYFRLLNIDILSLEEGRCIVEADIERKHMNCFGGMHGGVYESIMDTAAYWALYAEMPENAGSSRSTRMRTSHAPCRKARMSTAKDVW